MRAGIREGNKEGKCVGALRPHSTEEGRKNPQSAIFQKRERKKQEDCSVPEKEKRKLQ